MKACRSCGSSALRSFCDLGMSPPSNAFLTADRLNGMEAFFPLHAFVCEACLLVQVDAFHAPDEIFSSDYAYFSSYSEGWLRHAKAYVDMMSERFSLDGRSFVVEIASNDGYLLQYFNARGVPCLGVEPTRNTADAAIAKGVPTRVEFFGTAFAEALAAEGRKPDLVLGNNVLAHVPDLNDFVRGVKRLLAPAGVNTFEFPYLERLLAENQFDTIYHEHFCYFSLHAVEAVFRRHGLELFDVERLPTHGGSLRIFAQHAGGPHVSTGRVEALRGEEQAGSLDRIARYDGFGEQVRETKRALLDFLIGAKRAGKSIAGYGAAAKGNTLLNYCGVRTDFIDYVVDRNPHKQGRFLPGTHIPVQAPERIRETRPDYLLILPWNIKAEVMTQMGFIRDWGGRFVVPIPRVEVLP
jgi:SAM-dependent methyltransferase